MNTYRVVLVSFGTVFVEADSVSVDEGTVTFFRGGHVCAEYPRTTVKSYEVAHLSPSQLLPEREDSQVP